MKRIEIERITNAALGDAIRDRCNAMLADGSTLEQVVDWARSHGADFHQIRERAIALAMDRQPVATCKCDAHRQG